MISSDIHPLVNLATVSARDKEDVVPDKSPTSRSAPLQSLAMHRTRSFRPDASIASSDPYHLPLLQQSTVGLPTERDLDDAIRNVDQAALRVSTSRLFSQAGRFDGLQRVPGQMHGYVLETSVHIHSKVLTKLEYLRPNNIPPEQSPLPPRSPVSPARSGSHTRKGPGAFTSDDTDEARCSPSQTLQHRREAERRFGGE